jgi:hypothetical protein
MVIRALENPSIALQLACHLPAAPVDRVNSLQDHEGDRHRSDPTLRAEADFCRVAPADRPKLADRLTWFPICS